MRLISNRHSFRALLFGMLLLSPAIGTLHAQSNRRLTIAVVDFGNSEFARTAADTVAATLIKANATVLDRDQVRAAARGAGYNGSLNMSLSEARTLGETIGSDFMLLGDAQTLRRSPSSGPVYYESYASVFAVSSRTGKLITWERPNFRASDQKSAERALLDELAKGTLVGRLFSAINEAEQDERAERALFVDSETPVIEEAPDDEKLAEAEGLRLPKPFRRFVPAYPDSAAAAEAEAMVDVVVDLDSRGEITHSEVVRWAGFGLDQATLETVRRLHFFPAMRNGTAMPIRVLLRYNFRKPPVTN
ncbi:MAG TPA: energy transducer TonB [Pyrinomonadaceae bacterium]|nr:energy transducer TonB [Pyrinomonadaceae bacterium]